MPGHPSESGRRTGTHDGHDFLESVRECPAQPMISEPGLHADDDGLPIGLIAEGAWRQLVLVLIGSPPLLATLDSK